MKRILMHTIKLISVVVIITLIVTRTGFVDRFFTPSTAYAVGDLMVDWGSGYDLDVPLFSLPNILPGESSVKIFTVKNNAASPRPVGIKGIVTDDNDNLASQMNIEIKDGATVLYANNLATFFTESTNPDGIPLNVVSAGATKNYTVTVEFISSAGNEFQNTNVVFNIIVGIAVEIPEACSAIDLTGKFPIFGTDDSDTINGTTKDDVIFTFGGNDRVLAKGGNDCIVGGEGNDTLYGETGNDFIFGEEGADTLVGAVGKDLVVGGPDADIIRGENGDDELYGDGGNDTITGGNDNDDIFGGQGNDTINAENGTDLVEGNEDNDSILGGNGPDTLRGNAGTDTVNGQAGRDSCEGEAKSNCEIVI